MSNLSDFVNDFLENYDLGLQGMEEEQKKIHQFVLSYGLEISLPFNAFLTHHYIMQYAKDYPIDKISTGVTLSIAEYLANSPPLFMDMKEHNMNDHDAFRLLIAPISGLSYLIKCRRQYEIHPFHEKIYGNIKGLDRPH